jgi:hypothetical protein
MPDLLLAYDWSQAETACIGLRACHLRVMLGRDRIDEMSNMQQPRYKGSGLLLDIATRRSFREDP